MIHVGLGHVGEPNVLDLDLLLLHEVQEQVEGPLEDLFERHGEVLGAPRVGACRAGTALCSGPGVCDGTRVPGGLCVRGGLCLRRPLGLLLRTLVLGRIVLGRVGHLGARHGISLRRGG